MALKIIPGEGGGTETLPAAGDERREVLRERADALEEKAETLGVETGRIDPAKLTVDREIRQHMGDDGTFNELEVSHKLDEYEYIWAFTGQNGRFIRMYQFSKYEVVQGDMPEAQELKGIGADTTRHLGDCILMRIRRDHYLKLMRQRKEALRIREEGVTGAITELGEKYGMPVSNFGQGDPNKLPPNHPFRKAANEAQAEQAALRVFDRLIREGRIPGMPTPR